MPHAPDLEEFALGGKLPFDNRLFFIQHLKPYEFFSENCRGKKVLEIGTGQGFGSYYLAKAAAYVAALDISLPAYDYIRRYQEKYAVKNISFVNADAVRLPFKDDSFDRVISTQVIEHIPPEELILFLKEIRRVLRKNGECLISTLNIENSVKNPLTYTKFAQHHKEFNRGEFKALLARVFDKVKLSGVEISPKHRFFRRLKRWGFLKYDFKGHNPVKKFYERVSCRDFVIAANASKRSLDLVGLCVKA